MAHDLRELFEKERKNKTHLLKKGHENRFLNRLEEKIPKEEVSRKSTRIVWRRVAATVIVLIGLGVYLLLNQSTNVENGTQVVDSNPSNEEPKSVSLGDLSPDLKKIESYYVTNINLELSEIDFTGENKVIVDGYMERLEELDKEYNRLNVELNEVGPNDDTINALIQNLQLRLRLLQKLRTKLNQLKSSKNEQESSNII